MTGLFKLTEEVEWDTTVRGEVRRLRGAIHEVVPAGARPQTRVRSGADPRDHESYVVGVGVGDPQARYYWPRVAALAPAAARWSRDPVAVQIAEDHARAYVTRERDAMRELLVCHLRAVAIAAPLTGFVHDLGGPGDFIAIKWWRTAPHGGVVEVVRMTNPSEPDLLAVYFANDAPPNDVDWLEASDLVPPRPA